LKYSSIGYICQHNTNWNTIGKFGYKNKKHLYMKHFNLIKKSIFTVVASTVLYAANAQTARFQLIHNSADPTLDTVDIYIDGNKTENIAFRQASAIVTASSANVKININNKNSTDSSDLVLARFEQTLAANSNTVLMITGVSDTTIFSNNPNLLSTKLQIVSKTISTWSAGSNRVQVNILHGVTDAPGVDLFSRPAVATGTLPTNLRFGQANGGAQAIFFNNTATFLEVRLAGTRNVVKSYSANLALFNQRMISIFASGFVNPSNNQNGKDFGLFAVDTNGTVIELPEATRLQFIHNAPDAAIGNVDIYLNNNKVAANLAFRAATPFITANAGNTEVLISTANQNDTLFYVPSVTLNSTKAYLAVALGLKDTTGFAVNPDGKNRGFGVLVFDSITEGSTVNNNFQFLTINGSPDAPALTLNNVNRQNTYTSDLGYGSNTPIISENVNSIFNISNSDKSVYTGSYRINASSLLNQSGVIFTSGFYSTSGNPTNAPTFKVMMALNNGTVVELPRLINKLQIIHNSADTTIRMVDVYANGVKILDDLGFRQVSGISNRDAYVPVRINITKGNESDTTNAVWSATILPDSNYNVAIAHGFVGAAYRSNPDGIATNFNVKVISPAKLTSSYPTPSNEVTFFQGAVNLGKIDMKGEQEAVFVAKNISYASVYKYSPVKGNAGATYIINDAVTGNGLYLTSVNLVGRRGLAGVMFASGIALDLRNNSRDTLINGKVETIFTANNKADSLLNAADNNLKLGFYLAWSNGTVDSFENVSSRTSVASVYSNKSSMVVYPNPASDKVSVMINATSSNNAQVNIIDIKGAIVKSINNKLVSGLNVMELSVADLPKGMYFVQITSNEGTSTKKLVIE
jgi:hypothetical protein